MPNTTENKPWERQKGESEKAFEAFRIYRDLGDDRSIPKVSQQCTKSESLLKRWSSKFNWIDRARDYDNELEKEAKAKAVKARKDMTARQIQISMKLQKKALYALKELSAADMSPKDIKDYLKIATDLERLCREPTEDEKGDVIYEMEIEDMSDIEIEIYGHR